MMRIGYHVLLLSLPLFVGCASCPKGGGTSGPDILILGGGAGSECNSSILIEPVSGQYDCYVTGDDCLCHAYFDESEEGEHDFRVTMDDVSSPFQEGTVYKIPDGCGANVDRVRRKNGATLVFFE